MLSFFDNNNQGGSMRGTSVKQILSGEYPRNSRLAQWDRRILKATMNVALFLTLAGAAMAIFDGGFSSLIQYPFGVQVSFSRHHWGDIDMDVVAPGFREKLPKNVELGSPALSAAVKNEHPDLTAKILSRLATVPSALILVAIVWLLRNIVLTTIGTETSDGDPFIKPNVRRLRTISVLLLVMPVIDTWSQIAEVEWLSRALPKGVPYLGIDLSSMPIFFGVGVLVLVLSEVFKIGVRLREDVEGLV
jgi:hypothetical protein